MFVCLVFVSRRSFVDTLLLMNAKTVNFIYLMGISFLIIFLYTFILCMGDSHGPHAVDLRMTYVFTVHLLHSIDVLMMSTNDLLSKYVILRHSCISNPMIILRISYWNATEACEFLSRKKCMTHYKSSHHLVCYSKC